MLKHQHSLNHTSGIDSKMPGSTTPSSPLKAGGEMVFREKTQSIFLARTSTARPVSEAFDTEFEDESDIEDGSAPKRSFDSVSDVLSESIWT